MGNKKKNGKDKKDYLPTTLGGLVIYVIKLVIVLGVISLLLPEPFDAVSIFLLKLSLVVAIIAYIYNKVTGKYLDEWVDEDDGSK